MKNNVCGNCKKTISPEESLSYPIKLIYLDREDKILKKEIFPDTDRRNDFLCDKCYHAKIDDFFHYKRVKAKKLIIEATAVLLKETKNELKMKSSKKNIRDMLGKEENHLTHFHDGKSGMRRRDMLKMKIYPDRQIYLDRISGFEKRIQKYNAMSDSDFQIKNDIGTNGNYYDNPHRQFIVANKLEEKFNAWRKKIHIQ